MRDGQCKVITVLSSGKEKHGLRTLLACADSSSVSVSPSVARPLMVTVASLSACCALPQAAAPVLGAEPLPLSSFAGPACTAAFTFMANSDGARNTLCKLLIGRNG